MGRVKTKQIKDKGEPARWITVKGKHLPVYPDGSIGVGEEKAPLEERVKGDALLDAQDLIEELKANGAEIDKSGYVTLYHHTTKQAAEEIYKSGTMQAKEDGIFFTTKKDSDAQAGGRGGEVITFNVPVEKLVLDDIFGDEAHVKIPLKNRNQKLNISEYIAKRGK